MKVLDILDESIVDGEGVRTVIYLAGCSHKCLGCHNIESWSPDNGKDMTVDEIVDYVKDLYDITLSGGDPLYQYEDTIELAKRLSREGKNIWLYTGYTIEEIFEHNKMYEILNYVDVVVDGRFEIEKKDLSLKFKGSSNQRIIRLI